MARERGRGGRKGCREREEAAASGFPPSSSSLNTIPNTDERIPRRAFQPHVPRFAHVARPHRATSPIRACLRLCARTHTGCARGGKDSRGRPEGLSEVRTVHYPRSRTPPRLFDSFPLAHRPRPSSTDPRAPSALASLFSLALSLYSRISSRDAATHRSFSPFWNAATSRNTSLRWMPAERRNTGRKSASGGGGGVGGGGKVTARRLQRERCCTALGGELDSMACNFAAGF